MKLHVFSYRYAEEILQHQNNVSAWHEIEGILRAAPIFIYPNKSKNTRLQIVQQLMNTYFDRKFVVDNKWEYHPLATRIQGSGLSADFRKSFGNIAIQAEIQFGNMARWYSDVFKFQAAYSGSLIQCGLCVVPVARMAQMIDSNVANYERAARELPSANLSLTLPILLIGLEPDANTPVVDVSSCRFSNFKQIVGKGKHANRWRIINGHEQGVPMKAIGPDSDTGPMLDASDEDEDTPGADTAV